MIAVLNLEEKTDNQIEYVPKISEKYMLYYHWTSIILFEGILETFLTLGFMSV